MAIFAGPQADWDVWLYEWTRDSLTRLTSDPGPDQRPIWTPDGRRIAFGSQRGSSKTSNVYWQRADGTGDVQRLTESTYSQSPASWHPSSKFLAFTELKPQPQTGVDLMILPLEGDETSGWKPGKPIAFLSTPFTEQEPMFSPDGRWLAYQSNESGEFEVYVRPFPGPGGKVLVSTAGGAFPAWSRAKRELLYQSPDRRIMVASYAVNGDTFVPDKPRPWSEQRFVLQAGGRSFDLHPDGERLALAVAQDLSATKQDKVVFIFNFFDEIRRLAPNKN
jgi:serine/threonine-protein kinase